MEIQLDDWQKEVLESKGDILLCTGRRVGKTYILSRKAAERMIKEKTEIVAVSLTEDQAKLIIMFTLIEIEKIGKQAICRGLKKPIQNRIILKNGSKITAKPVGNTGDSVRGFQGDVLIVDEASRQPKLMWAAAKPILLTTGGEIWMCSTPFGKSGYFWEQFDRAYNKKEPTARFRAFYISSEDVVYNRAISESWTKEQREAAIRILEEEKRDMSKLEYGQEYLGLFLEDLQQFFPDDWIERVCILRKEETALKKEGNYLGVDIARMGGDEIAFEALHKITNENIMQTLHETEKEKLTTWTENRIYEIDTIYNFQKIYIDAGAGSLGVGIFDNMLRNPQTKRKVEAINNRKLVMDREDKTHQRLLKEDLYNNLLNLGDRGHIRLFNDDKIKLSLKSVQWEYLNNEKGKAQMRIFGNYTHIAEALIRAAWCAKEKSLNIWIRYTGDDKQWEENW